ncbi:transcriptional regulator [Mycolicibacterium canariasense]|uniref:Transcriptional regulator n=1 Tax=Mycolicibacterium canariasense TaxID=228230 RepID=A0A100WD94_MYCCR|nr:TetR/AcrR family transcriptional regulator [Mycolicibacterium canariasense]MCV7207801.1 TetR/AcrR family transcriptional regulator [Mycolicibacterium canariasense]ORV04861.1 TetR family transcriptional regulator [Mycolicibacterium canariasense]GAS96132.1 transcriptional regulator [Mycolicibacterium canariasense]
MPRPDRSRAALLDTAAQLFRRQGYAATGINQILDVAQVKAGSLYHHFPDGKAELAAAVVDTVGGGIGAVLRQMLAADEPAADLVDRWVDVAAANLRADERDGCPIEPIATEAVTASPVVRAAATRAFGDWLGAVADRLRADGWDPVRADETARAVLSLIEGALLLSRVSGEPSALLAAKTAARVLLERA